MNHTIYRKILKNKLKIILIPVEYTQTVAVGIFVKVGSRYETENNNGISHFLEHMIFKGTKNYPNTLISEKLDAVGAIYNAETSYEMTNYYIYGHKSDLDLFIKIIIDIYVNPLIKDDDVNLERSVVNEELNMYKDDQEEILDNYIYETLFGNSSLKLPILGTKKILSGITKKDLVNFRKKYYVPERTVFVISGDFERKKVFGLLEKKLSKLKNGTHDIIIPIQDPIIQTKKETYKIVRQNMSQILVTITFKSHSIFSTYSDIYDIIGDILSTGSSSRLFNLLRNKMGVTYFNYSENHAYTYEGLFIIHLGVDSKRANEVILKVLEEIDKMKKKGITKEELEKAKKIRITAFALGLQTPQELMNFYGTQEIMFKIGAVPHHIQSKKNVRTRIEDYEKIELETVNAVIKDLFIEEKMNLFICGE